MSQGPRFSELMAAIVDLHGAVTHGFARVDRRFAQLDARLDLLEPRVTSIAGEVAGAQRWMARSDQRFDVLEIRSR